MWYCKRCGSENVSQGWITFLPMNKQVEPAVDFEGNTFHQSMDSYWCEDCDKECEPFLIADATHHQAKD